METICSQTNHCALNSLFCFIYDFQTLLTGIVAIVVAIFAGIPVWRQLKDTNLQTCISHRETLANLLRDALQRFQRVDQSIREPLSMASRATSDPEGKSITIGSREAHHLDQMFHGVLDWYLVVLANTEHDDIEVRKSALRSALGTLANTLNDAHWADHNEQQDENHDIPDDEWARIVARCATAKIEASQRVREVQVAYAALCAAQEKWDRSLRGQIAKLDLQISGPR
ncbi:MAG: hypothetical protein KGK02_10825 [Rhodospirillales bacterium]|nr:hypothetical protein [Rhodospirillales bacterium]